MRAVVVGAGIGGLTTAVALRAAGVEALVCERAPELSRILVGGGIHLWPNGVRALGRIGLGDAVQDAAGAEAVVERAEFLTAGGKLLGAWPVGDLGRTVGAPTVGIARSALQEALAGALGADALALGETCTGFEQDADGVTVRFESGREERADVAVGADGLRSTVRAQLLGAGEPRYAGYASWQAFCELDADRLPVGLFRVWWGRGARFLLYRVRDRAYWEGIVAVSAGRGAGGEEGRRFVRERFAGWPEPVEAAVEATEPAAIGYAEVFDRPPVKRWGEGRVTLLGDAAHAMTNATAQGANQAIEDAVVLAEVLAGAEDPAAALRAYEARRIPPTTTVVRRSWYLTRAACFRRGWACALRDRWLSLTLGGVVYKGLSREMAREP